MEELIKREPDGVLFDKLAEAMNVSASTSSEASSSTAESLGCGATSTNIIGNA